MNPINKDKSFIPEIRVYLLLIILFSSCKKFLEERPNKQLVVPSTVKDAQALLDYYTVMNTWYPPTGAMSDDDYYLADTYYNSATTLNQNIYTWAKDIHNDNDWNFMYSVVLSSNLALETIDKINADTVRGSALFFRANAFYQLAQYYAVPYDKSTASQLPGIPLRLTSNVTEPIARATLEDTYGKILSDLKMAVTLLPVINLPVSRPSKTAAYGLLARVYMAMEDYSQAGKYADSSLSLYNSLLNYNSIDPAAAVPFTQFNAEVIWHTTVLVSAPLSMTNWRLDSSLYTSYATNDLRRVLFFKSNGSGAATYYTFKGNYDASTSGAFFNGITTAEMYLVRAECAARRGDKDAAMSDLNTLLQKRWKTGTYALVTAVSADDALVKVLQERRKELVGRGLRWFDLRRLNRDSRFAKTLMRIVNGQQYLLAPNDPRYTFFIPQLVIDLNGLEQNPR